MRIQMDPPPFFFLKYSHLPDKSDTWGRLSVDCPKSCDPKAK